MIINPVVIPLSIGIISSVARMQKITDFLLNNTSKQNVKWRYTTWCDGFDMITGIEFKNPEDATMFKLKVDL